MFGCIREPGYLWGGQAEFSGAHEIEPPPGDSVTATVIVDEVEIVPEVLRLARDAGGEVREFALHQPNLQDAFIALTGHGLRDAV